LTVSKASFYFDESVEVAVSIQIERNGIDAVSAHSLGDTDAQHLRRSTQLGRILCTCDADFPALAKAGIEHSGNICARERRVSVGDWIRQLRVIHANQTAETMWGLVCFLRSGR
jgi:hypothetical protein